MVLVNKELKDFQSEIERVNRELIGFTTYENITYYYDEFNMPILDITDNGDTLTFYFRESSKEYTLPKTGEANV